jgi:DNA-binding beta-propeller fold protein YncE
MKTSISVILFIVINFQIAAQHYNYSSDIGDFKNASSFYINSSGHIYIVDSGSNEVFKLDTTGIQLKFAGGFGWNTGAFDEPVDVFATSLSVYVADKNNHRIQWFDKDLNFISLLSTRENENQNEQFGYPAGCVTSAQGDLFILDSENKRIIKFDLFGNFIQNFGGFDYGKYSLNKPSSIAVSPSNTLFVLDDTSLVLFDAFGNGISKTNLGQTYTDIRIMFNNLTISSAEKILWGDLNYSELKLNEVNLYGFKSKLNIVSSIIFNDKLYVLTPVKVLIFIK